MSNPFNTLSKEFIFCTAHTCEHGWESYCNVNCQPHIERHRPLAMVRRERDERLKKYTLVGD